MGEVTNFDFGVSSFGVTLMGGSMMLPRMGGKPAGSDPAQLFFVDPANGNDSDTGLDPDHAFDTVSAAYAKTVDKRGDVIALLNDGNVSGTSREDTTLTWSNDNTHLIGLCAPVMLSQRARISPTAITVAVTPQLLVSGNGNIFQNISFFEGNTDAADSTCVSVTGARNFFNNVAMMNMGGLTSNDARTRAGSNVLLLTAAEENTFRHCYIGLDTAVRTAANANVKFASAATRNLFEDCIFPMFSTGGGSLFIDADSSGALDRWTIFRNCLFINAVASTGAALTEVANVHASAGGMIIMDRSFFVGATDWEAVASGNVYMGMPVADVAGNDAGGRLAAHS